MNAITYTSHANAKINLSLEVLCKKEDGFHDLNTVFAPIDLTDKLSFCCNNSEQFTILTANKTLQKDNICEKAYWAFCERYAIKNTGCELTLEKNIPFGAGLGGGSADAAFTLKVLKEIYKTPEKLEDLLPIARKLGSDVAFFLENKTAIGTGRGDILQPINFALPYRVILINPNIHVSTAFAYNSLNITKPKQATQYGDFLTHHTNNLNLWKDVFRNDFEKSVFEKYPIIADIKQKLYDYGSFFAQMSGSGSTVFGVFEDSSISQNAAQKLRTIYPDFFIHDTQFLN